MRKVLVSLPETDLRIIDAAARKAGETRSSFVRRAALA
jgi:metal-responsive CopG/Arc/MetJ family transcriptional regulator